MIHCAAILHAEWRLRCLIRRWFVPVSHNGHLFPKAKAPLNPSHDNGSKSWPQLHAALKPSTTERPTLECRVHVFRAEDLAAFFAQPQEIPRTNCRQYVLKHGTEKHSEVWTMQGRTQCRISGEGTCHRKSNSLRTACTHSYSYGSVS